MSKQVRMTRLEVPDYDLGLRGKLVRSEKTSGSGGAGLAFCTIVHGLSLADEVCDTHLSGAANGYPDALLELDESTRVELGWRPGTDAIIGDLVLPDGSPHPASPRGRLRQLLQRYRQRDLEPVLGYEYELWILRDPEPSGARDVSRLVPLGSTENAYSLTRLAEAADLVDEFLDRMESLDHPVEAFHSELGPGFFEFAMRPQPALRAADGAARARQLLRELCAERGLRASFMAKPYGDRSGAGGHVHSSLTRGGRNVFADAPGELSRPARCYLAGLLETMAEMSLLFTPYVNSFKRLDAEQYTPVRATWGVDDRRAACRVVTDTVSGARVEHRRPGADASPYLVAAGLLAGGLHGLEQELDLVETDPVAGAPLPAVLGEAIALFEDSPLVKQMLGEDFARAFAATRRAELTRYEQHLRTTITDWELIRHLEHS